MIPPEELFIIQPETPEQVDALADDLQALVSLIPGADTWGADYMDAIKDYPHYLTIVYHHDKPIGYIQIEDNEGYPTLGKDSLEFSGSVIPEYRAEGITQAIAPMVIRKAFKTTGKRKMLAKIDPENKEAQMAIVALGFKRVEPHPDLPMPDKLIYKLTRQNALSKEIS